MIKGWEHFVNSHSQDFSEPCEIFITGSNSEMLSGELATLTKKQDVINYISALKDTILLHIPSGIIPLKMPNCWRMCLFIW